MPHHGPRFVDGYQTVHPEETVAEGCPVLTKLRHVTVAKGVQAYVHWHLRDPEGFPVRLVDAEETDESVESSISTPDAEEPFTISVRFVACDELGPVWTVQGVIEHAYEGEISFILPAELVEHAGIYKFSIGVLMLPAGSTTPQLVFTEPGLLSVERSMFGDLRDRRGPPTLSEIRMAIRDSATENNLLAACEFSSDEVIYSIVRPIAEWNETPPDVAQFTCTNFPWREAWLKAIIGYLLQNAGFHYARNKLPSSHGGLTVSDKDKDNLYFALSDRYRQEWKEWMLRMKVTINAGLGVSSMGSPYGYSFYAF